MKILTILAMFMTLTMVSGFAVADVAVGEVGTGATPGDQVPKVCVQHRDVHIGSEANPPGINIFDYRTSLYAFTGEQIEYTAVVRDPNGVLDIGFLKALIDDSEEVLCNPVMGGLTTIETDTLCYKDGNTGWQCGENPRDGYENAGGDVTYKKEGETLEITVELAGLLPNTEYQLTLNGRDGNDGNVPLGNNCDNPGAPAAGYTYAWECGSWTGGTGVEGFWNFDMAAMTDANGDFTKTYYLEMPVGHYGIGPTHNFGFGFIVKEFEDLPGGSHYPPVLMETNGLDWHILPDGTIKVAECNGFGTLSEETDQVFHCLISVEPLWHDDSEVKLTSYNSQNTPTDGTHTENWFFNPAISLAVTTSDGMPIAFEPLPYGADTPEERFVHSLNKIKVQNTAEGGVNLWTFIAGTDLYDPSGASKCPTTNYIDIEQYMWYRGWSGTQWTSWEGWNQMSRYDQNDGCAIGDTATCYGGKPVPYDPNTPITPYYSLQNLLTNQGTLEIEFKLQYPMPCVGSFSQGTIYVFGKAV